MATLICIDGTEGLVELCILDQTANIEATDLWAALVAATRNSETDDATLVKFNNYLAQFDLPPLTIRGMSLVGEQVSALIDGWKKKGPSGETPSTPPN